MVLKIWFQTSSIKVNSVLARNADSWASLQAHWIKNSGVGPKNLICTAGCYDACSNLSPRALERRGQRPLASNRNSEIGIHSLLPHLEEWPLLYHFLGSKGYRTLNPQRKQKIIWTKVIILQVRMLERFTHLPKLQRRSSWQAGTRI